MQCAQRGGAVSARRLALVEATLAHARRAVHTHVGEAFGRRACRRLSSSMAMSPFTSVASAPAADRAAMASTTSASARIVIAGRERTRAVGGGYTTASYKDYAVKAARLFTVSPNRAESRPQVFCPFLPPLLTVTRRKFLTCLCELFRPSSRPTNSCAPTANATPWLMGCGASKDGASGNAGDRPMKQGDPMVTTFVQNEASVAGPVRPGGLEADTGWRSPSD